MYGGFVSHFRHSLDPKKRLTIPSEWRDQVGQPTQLYAIPGLNGDQCVYVYPARFMAKVFDKFRQIGISDKKARISARVLASRSDLMTWDSQGRIRVKDELLGFAGMVDQVEMVGAFDHFELWNPQQWQATEAVDQVSMEDALRYTGL